MNTNVHWTCGIEFMVNTYMSAFFNVVDMSCPGCDTHLWVRCEWPTTVVIASLFTLYIEKGTVILLKGSCSKMKSDTDKLICDLSKDFTCRLEAKILAIDAVWFPQKFTCKRSEDIVTDRSDGNTSLITLIYRTTATKCWCFSDLVNI